MDRNTAEKMALRQPSIVTMLGRILEHYAWRRDDAESWLPGLSSKVQKRGYFTLDEFLQVYKWKAPRAVRRYQDRTEDEVVSATRRAIRCSDDLTRIRALLDGIAGIRAPIASAILAACDPAEYGVIDVRAWQALYALGAVRNKASGTGLTEQDWVVYVELLRGWARDLNTTPRRLDFSLWLFHHCLYPDRIGGKPLAAIPEDRHCQFGWLLD